MSVTPLTSNDRANMSTPPPPPLVGGPCFTTLSPKQMKTTRVNCLKRQFDVEVFIRGKLVDQVHKTVLEMVSPVFKLLLRRRITEQAPDTEETKLPYLINLETDQDVFNIIKHFLYTDELLTIMTNDLDLALQVLEASFHYAIDRLMKRTIVHLQKTIGPESAFKILQTARAVECSELEELALETIYRNPNQLFTNKDFHHLGCYDVCRILSSDDLACKEDEVLEAAYSWALHQCKEIASPSGDPSSSLKYYFSQVSPYIRFPLMTAQQLAKMTLKRECLLPSEDIIKLFQSALLPEEDKPEIELKYNDKPRSFHLTHQERSNPQRRPLQTPPPPVGNPNPRKRLIVPTGPESTESHSSSTMTDVTSAKLIRQETIEDSEDDLFTFTINRTDKKVPTYEDAVRRYVEKTNEKENASAIIFSNLMIENYHKRILLPNCNEVSVDAKCSFFDSSDASFLNFVSRFDPMRYILFDTTNAKVPMIPENIWGLKQDILLKFNGVTFLNVQHILKVDTRKEEVLVLNYISDSKRIMSHSKPTVLALSNCELSAKHIRDKGKHLEKLVLYRVWGDITLEEIMKDCPNLTELVCWKHVPRNWIKEREYIPGFCTPLSLNFSNPISTKHNIRKLALFKTELKFPMRCACAATSVTELVLDHCYYVVKERNANIQDVFHHVFPNVKKIILVNDPTGNMYKPGILPVAIPSLINCARKNITTLKFILVSSMIWGDDELEDAELATFFDEEAKVIGKPKDFSLEKTSDGTWRGSGVDKSLSEQLEGGDNEYWNDKTEYDCFNLNYFYDSVETFENYFKQGDNFPRPLLWT